MAGAEWPYQIPHPPRYKLQRILPDRRYERGENSNNWKPA